MNTLKLTFGLVLAALIGSVHAVPVGSDVTANSPSAKTGETVVITLEENNTAGLDGAATISVFYDPLVLKYVSGAPGSLFDPFAIGLDPTTDVYVPGHFFNPLPDRHLLIAQLFGPPAVPEGIAGSLLALTFEITGKFPVDTDTFVIFNCYRFDLTSCTPGDPPSLDYRFDEVQAKVTVLADSGNAAPLPGTLPLLGLGMAALIWARRRP